MISRTLGSFASVNKIATAEGEVAPATNPPTSRVCISLCPDHADTLSDRSKTFNIGPTAVIKLLLEIERRDGLIAREVALRLNRRMRRAPLRERRLTHNRSIPV